MSKLDISREVGFIDYAFRIRVEVFEDGSCRAFLKMSDLLSDEVEITHVISPETIARIIKDRPLIVDRNIIS